MTNSKVPVHDGSSVPPPGAPHEQPCGCKKPGSTIIEVLDGGGGGTRDYEVLVHKPSINGVVIVGDMTFESLGLGIATLDEVHALFGLGA